MCSYPDTTRFLRLGVEAVENVEAATYLPVHTYGEPTHTLSNAIILVEENSGTRMKDNGTARGRRGSLLHVTTYLRLDEVGLWMQSAIGDTTTTAFKDTTHQTLTMVGSPTGGTFTLTYTDATGDAQTTSDIPYNETGANIQTALEALSNVTVGDVTVTGSASGPWPCVFNHDTPGINGTNLLVADNTSLSGGTSPHVTVAGTDVTGVYQHEWDGASDRGLSLSWLLFNGLYWRKGKGARVNTCNVQAVGNGIAQLDLQIIGRASAKVDDPADLPEDNTYIVMDAPMQAVKFAGLINADTDRMALNINNNLTQRSPMDGSTSQGRTRFGNFQTDLDGMVDYPAYAGSLYEAFEANTPPSSMDVVMVDDQSTVGTSPTVHPFVIFRVTKPLLVDTTEGSDSGELVQMVKGRARYDPVTGAGLKVILVNGKADSYYSGT